MRNIRLVYLFFLMYFSVELSIIMSLCLISSIFFNAYIPSLLVTIKNIVWLQKNCFKIPMDITINHHNCEYQFDAKKWWLYLGLMLQPSNTKFSSILLPPAFINLYSPLVPYIFYGTCMPVGAKKKKKSSMLIANTFIVLFVHKIWMHVFLMIKLLCFMGKVSQGQTI